MELEELDQSRWAGQVLEVPARGGSRSALTSLYNLVLPQNPTMRLLEVAWDF